MEVLEGITHPIYKKISEKIPPVGGFDLSPFILLLVVLFLERLIYRIGEMLL